MKKTVLSLIILFSAVVTANAQIESPYPSPHATAKQTVGITDITINYSSPGVKGRTIWGELVPYNEIWRTGANQATNIEFSRDVEINGVKVKAGQYGIYTIPTETEWTVIINNKMVSAGQYDEKEDVVRIKVTPTTIPNRERLAFIFSDFDDNGTRIDLEWEKLRVSFNVKVATDEQVRASIKEGIDDVAGTYTTAARYLLEHGTTADLPKALEYINNAIALNNWWLNYWVKAEILHKQGKTKEAIAAAKMAKEEGDKEPARFFWKDRVEAALKEWK